MMKKNSTLSKPTIYDIAKAAGVSPGTVSRALNNVGYIKYETRKKIETVIKQFDYIPNRAARSLKTKRTGLIMLAIPDTDNPFYVDMIKAVQDVVKANDNSMVLYYTEGKKNDEIKALKMLHENFADALIMVNFYFTKEYRKEIDKIKCPVVLSGISVSDLGGGEDDRFDYVGVDCRKGIYLSTMHLIGQGHINIGYIAGIKELNTFMERCEGYREAFMDSGIKIREELIYWENYNESSGYKAGKYFLGLKNRPSAICAANDMMAMGALRAMEDSSIKVPEDMSVVGMDNNNISGRLKPGLSSVSIAQSEIGRTAAELIFKRLKGEENGISKKIIFEPRLIVRESSIIKKVI
jgi:LacI family transcriptional regulator